MQPQGEISFRVDSVFFQSAVVRCVVRGSLGSGLEPAVRLLAAPDRPDDASQLVGDGDGGFVVDVGLAELVGPDPEAVYLPPNERMQLTAPRGAAPRKIEAAPQCWADRGVVGACRSGLR